VPHLREVLAWGPKGAGRSRPEAGPDRSPQRSAPWVRSPSLAKFTSARLPTRARSHPPRISAVPGGRYPHRIRRPTAPISSAVRSSWSACFPPMTQWRAWSSRPSLNEDDDAVAGVPEVERLGGHAVGEGLADEGECLVPAVAAVIGRLGAGAVPAHLRVEHVRGRLDVPAGECLPPAAQQLNVARGHVRKCRIARSACPAEPAAPCSLP